MGLLRLLSFLSSAKNWKSTLATARESVAQLRTTAGQFQTALFQRTRAKALEGNPDAQYELGEYFYDGRVVPQDYTEAFGWFLRAAQRGHAKAQCNVGLMCLLGRGVERDCAEAFKWLTLSAAQGNEEARIAQERARKKLSSLDIAEGTLRAEAFRVER